jgi:hypothetical protein
MGIIARKYFYISFILSINMYGLTAKINSIVSFDIYTKNLDIIFYCGKFFEVWSFSLYCNTPKLDVQRIYD